MGISVAEFLENTLGTSDIPVRIEAYDGSSLGPAGAETLLHIKNQDAIHRVITARGREIGFSRAIIAGDIDIEGDVYGIFEINKLVARPKLNMTTLSNAASLLGISSISDIQKLKPLAPPPEEVRQTGKLHSLERDKRAISSHYDVSNNFYETILDNTWTYSCAVYETEADSLQQAQDNKHDLVCRKLRLKPGLRHLDIGCGWGSMSIHAAKQYGTRTIGVTISEEQAAKARERIEAEGLSDRVEIRLQDYREIPDGPFDAISSIGMAEHVGGPTQLRNYFKTVRELLTPTGRYLNHAIGAAAGFKIATSGGFIQRYVFPDGHLHELGATITAMAESGFEVRHAETFRLHYARTLREWVTNLEANWSEVVADIGEGKARVWLLYMAGSAVAFENDEIELHQVLAIRNDAPSDSIPLLQDW